LYDGNTLWPLRFHREACCDKARAELGYSSRPIEATVGDTVEWLQGHFLEKLDG
jgi:nucleoside-diphosphate-sugar epimerase